VAGGRWVILCQRPVSHSMDPMFFSPTPNAEAFQRSAYEISFSSSLVSDVFWLQASCTAMGNLIFTLTHLGRPGDVSSAQDASTWTDTILTYRSREAPKPWQSIAGNTTLRRFVISKLQSLSPVVETPDGEVYYETAQMPRLFWHELKSTIRGICASLWSDYCNFVSGDGGATGSDTVDELATSFWNQTNFENGFDYP